jgi:hypothetical protein
VLDLPELGLALQMRWNFGEAIHLANETDEEVQRGPKKRKTRAIFDSASLISENHLIAGV